MGLKKVKDHRPVRRSTRREKKPGGRGEKGLGGAVEKTLCASFGSVHSENSVYAFIGK